MAICINLTYPENSPLPNQMVDFLPKSLTTHFLKRKILPYPRFLKTSKSFILKTKEEFWALFDSESPKVFHLTNIKRNNFIFEKWEKRGKSPLLFLTINFSGKIWFSSNSFFFPKNDDFFKQFFLINVINPLIPLTGSASHIAPLFWNNFCSWIFRRKSRSSQKTNLYHYSLILFIPPQSFLVKKYKIKNFPPYPDDDLPNHPTILLPTPGLDLLLHHPPIQNHKIIPL